MKEWKTVEEMVRELAYAGEPTASDMGTAALRQLGQQNGANLLQNISFLCLATIYMPEASLGAREEVLNQNLPRIADRHTEVALHLRLMWERALWRAWCDEVRSRRGFLEKIVPQRLPIMRSLLQGYDERNDVNGQAMVMALAGAWYCSRLHIFYAADPLMTGVPEPLCEVRAFVVDGCLRSGLLQDLTDGTVLHPEVLSNLKAVMNRVDRFLDLEAEVA